MTETQRYTADQVVTELAREGFEVRPSRIPFRKPRIYNGKKRKLGIFTAPRGEREDEFGFPEIRRLGTPKVTIKHRLPLTRTHRESYQAASDYLQSTLTKLNVLFTIL